MPAIWSLLLQIAVGVVVYVALNLLIKNKSLTYLLQALKNFKKARKQATADNQAEREDQDESGDLGREEKEE